MADIAPAAADKPGDAPRRCIFGQADMDHFRRSAARKELLAFVSAMGRGLTSGNAQPLPHGGYRHQSPLGHLTPALASLHGSLACMSTTWMDPEQGGIPPDLKAKARFGNPAFREWHARLVERSYGIVRCLMNCHVKYASSSATGDDGLTKEQILKECSDQGYHAASSEGTTLWPREESAKTASNEEDVIAELRAYLHDGFGHPIRIDYGTGHEASFTVFLLSLCKIGCFHWADSNNKSDKADGEGQGKPSPSPEVISLASLSLFHVYLNVTRGLQRDYMLEPAGSHGVWGLDDYHCVPFYLGACQMMAREQWQQQTVQSAKKKSNAQGAEQGNENDTEGEAEKRMPDNPYLPEATSPVVDSSAPANAHNEDRDHWAPSIIHNRQILEMHRPSYLYLSCIHFIQQIKPNVPFFESSPMLNDISQIGNWAKVSSGLLRLYEGEVLDKMPVVQHFVFGKIFRADWTPSRKMPLEAPKRTFINGPMGEECIAPWAIEGNGGDGSNASSPPGLPGGMPPTRAPWAK
ncbi:hypothetical protein ACHAXT_004363 [Thalassiosira profunda]